jgi:hypothetical protein
MWLLSSPDVIILHVYFSQKLKGRFITENEALTKCLINFKLFDYVFTECFPFNLIISQLMYKLETLSSLLAGTVDICQFLMNMNNSFQGSILAGSVFTLTYHPPFKNFLY